MRNITYLDTIRHKPDMKDLSIKTTHDPVKHQLEGGGLKSPFEAPKILREWGHRHGGNIGSLDKDPLRGGSVFGDLLKVAGVFDPTGLIRTASFVVK